MACLGYGYVPPIWVGLGPKFSKQGSLFGRFSRNMGTPFNEYRFRLLFQEQGIKRRQIFWSRLSKHVKRGNFVTTGYYVVKFLCF